MTEAAAEAEEEKTEGETEEETEEQKLKRKEKELWVYNPVFAEQIIKFGYWRLDFQLQAKSK